MKHVNFQLYRTHPDGFIWNETDNWHIEISNDFFKWYCKDKIIMMLMRFTPLQNGCLTLSWRRPLSYRNQSIDLLCKSMDWFLYDNGLHHERVNYFQKLCSWELRNSRVTKSSYKTKLRKMTSHFELISRKCL